MSTLLQQNLATVLIKNAKKKHPITNKGKLVEMGGYSKTVAVAKPQVIIEQKGVQEELDARGFTEGNAKGVVQKIMLDDDVEPNARLKATDQVFKVHGSYAPDRPPVTVNILSINATDPAVLASLQAIQDRLENE